MAKRNEPETIVSEGEAVPLPRSLEETSDLLASSGVESSREIQRLRELSARLKEGRFHLAVLGQFKRGKSTLLNALLGEPVLPSSVVPLTAIPTFVRAGEAPAATVAFRDEGRPAEHFDGGGLVEFLARYVTESGNPKNERGVEQVEVLHPAPILRRGVVLIDTPGIGSTFQHNTEATLNFLPQCDAALFLVSADPPMTAVESEFLREVRAKVPRLFFVLNKVDQLDDAERETAVGFLRQVLCEQADVAPEARIFCVSARRALAARSAGDDTLWEQSGLADVEHYLLDFFAREKAAALREAVAGKAVGLLDEALMKLRLASRSLELPMDELQQRLATFERSLEEIRRERMVAGDLLAGDRKRAHAFLERHAEHLRTEMRRFLEGIVDETLTRGGAAQRSEKAVQRALAEAVSGFCEHHLGDTTAQLSDHVGGILESHQQRAEALIEAVRRTAAELFDVPYHAPDTGGGFQMIEHPCWVTHEWNVRLIPLPQGLIDGLLSGDTRRRRLKSRLMEQVSNLILTNVERLRWTAYQSLDQTFRRFTAALDERLTETVAATHGAIRAALAKRDQHHEAVADELARLLAVTERLGDLRSALRGDGGVFPAADPGGADAVRVVHGDTAPAPAPLR